MIEEIKLMLGESAANYTEPQISLALKQAQLEVKSYCKRDLDEELELMAQKIAVVNLNRQGAEGISNSSYSGVSEAYVNGYPEEIMQVLRRKRKLRVI